VRTRIVVAAAAAVALLPGPAVTACHQAFFDPARYQVVERGGRVTITVRNPGPLPRNRTVDYETVNGTARAGRDFVAASGTLSFSPGDTSKSFDVMIIDDRVHEPTEAFQVRLRPRQGSCISDLGSPATVTIADDDPAPSPTSTGSSPSPTAVPTSPSPSPTPTSPSPSPSPTGTGLAAPPEEGGGLPAGAVGGIAGGAVVLGGVAAYLVRRWMRAA
jgi:hypothetical protein